MRAPGAMAARDGDSRQARRNQLVLFSFLAAAALAVFAFWLAAGGGTAPGPEARIEAELAGPGTAEESWTRRSEARLGALDTRLREMEAEARRLKQENARLEGSLRANADEAKRVIDIQKARIDELERGGAAPCSGGRGPVRRGAVLPGRGAAAGPGDGARRGVVRARACTAHRDLPARRCGRGVRGPGGPGLGRLAAGGEPCARRSCSRASTRRPGMASQGDPRPVLLRITGPAWTAAEDGTALSRRPRRLHGDGRGARRSLQREGLRAAAHPHLPGLRARHRDRDAGGGLRRGRRQDRGARAGHQPRGGAGGEGVPRGARLGARRGGLQRVLARRRSQPARAPRRWPTQGLGDIGRAGLGAGARTAGSKVADYLIRRAEQYQPVVQLQAGTRVTVVFIEGARLDGRTEREGAGS